MCQTQAEHHCQTGRAAVTAVNTLNSLMPDEFHELEGELTVEPSDLSDKVTVTVELDRTIDLHRNGTKPRFDVLEVHDDTLHIEFEVEMVDMPNLDYQIDMAL